MTSVGPGVINSCFRINLAYPQRFAYRCEYQVADLSDKRLVAHESETLLGSLTATVREDIYLEEIFKKLADVVIEGNVEKAKSLAEEALRLSVDPVEAIDEGLAKGVKVVGDRFENGEMFLTDLIMGGEVVKAGLEVLKVAIPKGHARITLGRILIGTVKEDIHSIGKDIVMSLLEASGFEVHDLGVDVPTEVYVEKTRELNPDLAGLSALMTITMPYQAEFIEALKKQGLRSKVKVAVGGAPTTDSWAGEIGADVWAEDAVSAVKKAKAALNIKN